MASNTEFLDLLMKDPVADKADTFNIETMLNENWRKIDGGLGLLAGCRDELAKLAPAHIYMEHWWKRRKAAQTFEPKVGEAIEVQSRDAASMSNCIVYGTTGTDTQTVTIHYADTVRHTTAGTLELGQPEALVISGGPSGYAGDNQFAVNQALLLGKYVQNNCGYILYVPAGTRFTEYPGTSTGKRWLCIAESVCRVTASVPAREWEYIHSDGRDTYPDTGVEGDWEYFYEGVPLDKTVMGARVVYGNYDGTGTYGADNPNTLTFGFRPTLVFFNRGVSHGNSSSGGVNVSTGLSVFFLGGNGGNSVTWVRDTVYSDTRFVEGVQKITVTDTGIEWYSEAGRVNYDSDDLDKTQLNARGTNYTYVAIG